MQRSCFYRYFLFLAALFIFQNLNAQSITKSYQFPKFQIFQFEYNDEPMKWLTFDGATALEEFPFLPAFGDKIEVNYFYTSYQYTLSNARYESLTAEEIDLIPAEYTFYEPKVNLKTSTDENKHYAMLIIYPFRKNVSGQFERLVSCDIRFEGAEPLRTTKRTGLINSVLASGTWYRIAVNSTGLHKVTYNDLKNLGINMSNLHASAIALFGNGGGAMPEINPVVQIDDLLECPIKVVDNGNGVFDENSYFVFYAKGPHKWEYNANTDIFTHQYNIYSDNACYFINVDPGIGEKKRIKEESFNQTANGTVTSFTYYDFYENDVVNFGESGKEWFDESLFASNSKTYNFTLPELFDNSARIKIRLAATSSTGSYMELSWGNNNRSFYVSPASASYYAYATLFEQKLEPFTSGNLALTLKYNSSQSSAPTHLDYIEIQAKCKLKITNNAMPFTITENIGVSHISSITLENASAQTKIWDVTDINAVYALSGTLSGTQFTFKTPTDKPRHFIAFNNETEYKAVTTVDKVPIQNLHGFKDVDMVIISHPDFLSEANRLAQFRAKENNITVKIVTPQQVYNEFSSGAQDPAAIRNFMRYLYDNDAQTIKYLLLFGRPSYDYRGRVTGTRIFVPNYQGQSSLNESSLRSCDDFFGILSIGGGSLSSDLINVAVGRFPVSTLAQAKTAVDKTINASVKYKIATQNASQVYNLGDWRNMITLVAGDEGTTFIGDAEAIATDFKSNYPAFNFDKIYCYAFPVVSYAGGQRYPDVTKAINSRMEKGTLAIAYFGHGGGNGWAKSRILQISDITNWTNKYNQPFMITITCSFAWYDKPALSPAEMAFLNDKGGVSAMITTSRVSYSNRSYGKIIFNEMVTKLNDRYKTVGEIHKFAKNNNGGTGDITNMIYLMGDPAMKINVPNHNVQTVEILDEKMQKMDTLKALSKVTVKGRVTDDLGNTLNFNGNIYPSIFDKVVKQKTLEQNTADTGVMFDVQKNVVFKGNATVTDGEFEFSFFVPKDINFEYGKGKISYYAASENDDAGDFYDDFIIGGMSNNPIVSDKGPEVNIYLNDEKFVPGGITNPDPVLIVKLKDEYGINTTGNGIGHDLVAILDNNIEKQMVLNDYYLADQDSYNSGRVRYALQDLTPGTHTLKIRAWNICNNFTEEVIDFVVKSDEKLELAHVLNYPNPFTTNTKFHFEHNQPGETFDILVHIFTVSGKLVKTLHDDARFLEGSNNYCCSDNLIWNGRDEYGDKVGKGVYLYRLTVRNSQGETAEKIEKIAIL